MPMRMESDLNRFRKIVRGKIKKELRRFISSGDLIGRQGKKQVTIPLPRIDIPHFQFGSNQQGGVGQGEGEEGDFEEELAMEGMDTDQDSGSEEDEEEEEEDEEEDDGIDLDAELMEAEMSGDSSE